MWLPQPGVSLDFDEIRAAIGELLPAYMVPSAFVALDAIPLTVNGKLDRRALPAPAAMVRAFRAPTNPIEQIVAAVFSELLGRRTTVSVWTTTSSHSAETRSSRPRRWPGWARLWARQSSSLAVRGAVRSPDLAASARRPLGRGRNHRRSLPDRDRSCIPLSLAQQRMWFLNQFDTAPRRTTSRSRCASGASWTSMALRSAVADLVARHESLRTQLPRARRSAVPDDPRDRDDSAPVPVLEVSADDVVGQVVDFVSRGFDVSTGVPIRLTLFDISGD